MELIRVIAESLDNPTDLDPPLLLVRTDSPLDEVCQSYAPAHQIDVLDLLLCARSI